MNSVYPIAQTTNLLNNYPLNNNVVSAISNLDAIILVIVSKLTTSLIDQNNKNSLFALNGDLVGAVTYLQSQTDTLNSFSYASNNN